MKFLKGTIFAAASLIAAAMVTPASATPFISGISISSVGSGPATFGMGTCGTTMMLNTSCQLTRPSTGGTGTSTQTVSFTIQGDPSGPIASSVSTVATGAPGMSGGYLVTFPNEMTDVSLSDGSIVEARFFNTAFSFALLPAPTSVPEPLTLSLFGAGLAGAFAARRKTKKT